MNVGDTARIGRGPWRGFSGRVTALFNGFTAVQLAGFERTFANDELAGDRAHRTVDTNHRDGFLSSCIDCGATAYNKQPQPPCPGVTT